MRTSMVFGLFFAWVALLHAQGRLVIPEIPPRVNTPQMELRSTDVRTSLTDGIASVNVAQVFFNPTGLRLEGEYVFMVAGESQMHDFHLYINGQKVRGELLDASEARETYLNIVRTLKDPALLEYAGYGVFRARIFPIEPNSESKIEFSYVQILAVNHENYRFTFPLKQTGLKSNGRFHMELTLQEPGATGNIYSPSHQIQISEHERGRAAISVEADGGDTMKDFILYYTVSNAEIHHSLLSFRPRTDRDGYFMLLFSPNIENRTENVVSKDVIFVTDVSGSMQGEKIVQARDALKFCIRTLRPEDRFDIISFSSTLQFFQGNLIRASRDARENAEYFVNNLSAAGGTNIDEALRQALRLKKESDERPTDIIFLTDGLPTEGETDIGKILKNVTTLEQKSIRVFSFGVGYDVNTYLLDKLSLDSGGRSDYVKPGENIESVISALFSKISSPFLTDVSLKVEGVQVYDLYPVHISNLYHGERITVLGRYRRSGKAELKISGLQSGKRGRFDYSVSFKERESESDFISKLWANRKVHHLLNTIRFDGENPELVETIKGLGREYGIVTPYTSYLVTEQEEALSNLDMQVVSGEAGVAAIHLNARQQAREKKAEIDEETIGSATYYQSLAAAPAAADQSTGRGAVYSSRAMKKLETAEKEVDMLLTIQRLGDRTFQYRNGNWIEEGISEDEESDLILQFLSDEYFRFAEKYPELGKILALGENLKFRIDGRLITVTTR